MLAAAAAERFLSGARAGAFGEEPVQVAYPSQLQEEALPRGALPHFRLAGPELQFPDEINLTEHFLDRNLGPGNADRVAFFSGPRSISYAGLYRQVNRLGNGLRALGVGKGDRVLLRIPNCIEFAVCALALHRIGAVVVPTNVLLRERVLEHIANTTEATAVIAHHAFLDELEAARPRLRTVRRFIDVGGEPAAAGYASYRELIDRSDERLESVKVRRDELATVFFTSGTTGLLKGCMHLALTIMAGPHVARHMFDRIAPGDVISGTPPLAFTFGYGNLLLLPLLCGVPGVLIEGRATPEAIFAAIEKHRVTLFNSVPTAYAQMLAVADAERRYDLSSLRALLSGSAPMPSATFRECERRFGAHMGNGMSSSECYVSIFSRWNSGLKPGSLGIPLPGWEIRILDEAGEDAPRGTPGRLAVRGPAANLYWRNPEAQAQSVIDGWSLTGDLVSRDEDGCYWHVCRSDDLIKSRGYRISPQEVEEALMQHPAVLEPAVIGVPDAVLGQKVKAFVVLRDDSDRSPALAQELRQFARSRLAAYQVPAQIDFIDALPRTETGKLRRKKLLEMALESP